MYTLTYASFVACMITWISPLSNPRLKGKEVIRWRVVRKYTFNVKWAADRSLITVCMHRRKESGTFRRCIKYESCQEFLRTTGIRRNFGRTSMPYRRQEQIRVRNTFCNVCRKHKFFKLINCILFASGDTGNRNSQVDCFTYLYFVRLCRNLQLERTCLLLRCISRSMSYASQYVRRGKEIARPVARARVNRFLLFSPRSSISRHVS